MEDFRSRLQPHVETVTKVDDLFRRGELVKAVRLGRRLRVPDEVMRTKTLAAARAMYYRCLPGVLLSAVFSLQVDVGYDVATLLRRAYECHDYHGFLKQAERFRVGKEFSDEARGAIEKLEEQGQVAQASAWRRKLARVVE